jgi:hypothetical protein
MSRLVCGWVSRPRLFREEALHQLDERRGVDRFLNVAIKSCRGEPLRLAAVGRRRDGQDSRMFEPRLVSDRCDHPVVVHPGHPDVGDHIPVRRVRGTAEREEQRRRCKDRGWGQESLGGGTQRGSSKARKVSKPTRRGG